jgi:hypothetical protein
MSSQDPANAMLQHLLDAIECERRAWNALQNPPNEVRQGGQALYAAWAHAVSSATVKAERFIQASQSRQGASS